MKKLNLVALAATSILAIGGLASCGGDTGSGSGSGDSSTGGGESGGGSTSSGLELDVGSSKLHIDFMREVAASFNEKRAAENKETVNFTYRSIEESSVATDIKDWTKGPDVYSFPSDQLIALYNANAVTPLIGKNKKFITSKLTEESSEFADIAGTLYGYPYAADNGYYLFYNKDLFKGKESSLDKFETLTDTISKMPGNMKLAYNLQDGYYGTGLMFTYGGRFKVTTNDIGVITETTPSYEGIKGSNAIKAMKKIYDSPVFMDVGNKAPTVDNKIAACVEGSWNIQAFKKLLGDKLGAVKLPTITVNDGSKATDTANIGSLLGYKLFGVNPSRGDRERQKLAHEFAQYLASEEIQLKRFNDLNIYPTDKVLSEKPEIKSNEFVKALLDQKATGNAVKQTVMPLKVWDAAKAISADIKDRHENSKALTDADIASLIESYKQTLSQK